MSKHLRLGDHIQVTPGFPFNSQKFNSDRKGVPLIRIRDIASDDTEVYFDGPVPAGYEVVCNDVLIGMDGNFRITTWKGVPGQVNQRVLRLRERPNGGLHLPYVAYLLVGRLQQIEDATGQTTVKHLKTGEVENTYITCLPYQEQQGIAEVLSALDEQIETMEATVHKLNMQRKGLAADLLTCRHLPTSEIADVRLAEVIPTVQYGISSSLTEAGAIPVLRMNNLSGGEIDVSDLKYSPTDVPSDLYLKPGDVLFNRTNSMEHVGRTSLWRGQLTKCTFASYLVRLSPDSKRLLPEYLVYLLEWEENQLQMRKYATPGVQQVNINPTSLRRCRVQIPKSLDAQRKTVAALDAARENIEALKEEVAKLKLQKQGLMRDLLTGAVRVTGAH